MASLPLAETAAIPLCAGIVTWLAEAAAQSPSIATRWRIGPRPPRSHLAVRLPATGGR